MTAFDDFGSDWENGVVTIGARQTWESYYTKMEKVASD